MKCPICTIQMVKGFLYGDRYALTWKPETEKLIGGVFATGGIKLRKNSGLIGRPKTISYTCLECNKIIIDLNTEQN